jgi:sortase A
VRKTIIAFIFILSGLVLGFGVFGRLASSGNVLQEPPPSPNSIVESSLAPVIAPVKEPSFISIPKINVRARVEQVGLDENNAMGIPQDENNAGWYKLGVRPGETGNSVIAAHYDKKDGSPAVFYSLSGLEKGDEIIVEDGDGKETRFLVTKTASYPLESFPLQEVFGKSDKQMLNLITCEGVYDKSSKLYSHRLVVFSEAIK